MAKVDEVKFTDEELKTIKEFQNKYFNIQMGFGQAEITKSRLERQLDDIFKDTDKLRKSLLTAQDEEKAFIEEVNKKYGDGVLDPQTGIFKPSESDK